VEDTELLLAATGAVLTLFIFSYLLGDNPLYRLALHIFVGASISYVFIIALRSVILPTLSQPDSSDSDVRILWTISLVGVFLGALLMSRGLRGLSWLSGVPVAILLGVGVGVALGGAILGTLMPQLDAVTNPTIPKAVTNPVAQSFGQALAVFGTVTGLTVFSFTGRRPTRRLLNRLLNGGARIGRWFVLIGFGAAYGGVLVASLALFADRVKYLIEVVERVSSGLR
jgi:hypothetical protein